MTPGSQDPMPPSGEAPVPQSIRGRYQIQKELGKGAFGEVYQAEDAALKRTVALKYIRFNRLGDRSRIEELRARFLREARVAAQLQHSSIVTIHDVISMPDTGIIVMELVEGKTLQQALSYRKTLRLSETVHILSQVADALHHAHQRNVVHRDVKPANILIRPTGQVKVADFGIAKTDSSADLTAAGNILGTPDYMAPEQAQGRKVDGRSDLFSLGCIFYECLTGKKPFPADNITGVLMRILTDELPPIDCEKHGWPKEVQSVLDRALAKDPSQRYSSGEELSHALRSIPAIGSGESVFVYEETTAADANGTSAGKSPDSVADCLMKEARKTIQIQPHLNALRDETRRLHLSASPLLQFRNVTLTPQEAFILTRVQDKVLPREIFSVSPLPEEETARALLGFLRTGLIGFESDTGPAGSSRDSGEEERPGRGEIEHLFELSQEQDPWQVLGLERGASSDAIKRAFQTKAFRYHPDRYAQHKDEDLQRKLSFLFRRVSDAFTELSSSGCGRESRS